MTIENEKGGRGEHSTVDEWPGIFKSAVRNPQSAIPVLFSVDSLVPRKNRVEVSGQGARVAVKGFYRAITPACCGKIYADKKSYSENEMREKRRKYECTNIDNAECLSSSLPRAEGC